MDKKELEIQTAQMKDVVRDQFAEFVNAAEFNGGVVACLYTHTMLQMCGVGKKTVNEAVYNLSKHWAVVDFLAQKGAGFR